MIPGKRVTEMPTSNPKLDKPWCPIHVGGLFDAQCSDSCRSRQAVRNLIRDKCITSTCDEPQMSRGFCKYCYYKARQTPDKFPTPLPDRGPQTHPRLRLVKV